jgi:Zeta toxin
VPPLPPGFKLDAPAGQPAAPSTPWGGQYTGLAARAALETPANLVYGLHDLMTMGVQNPMRHLANKYLGTHIPDEPMKTQQWGQALTDLGVPTPQTGAQRYALAAGEGVLGGPIGAVGKVNALKGALMGGAGATAMTGAADAGLPAPVQALAGFAGAAAVPGAAAAGRGLYNTLPGIAHSAAPKVVPPAGMPPENAGPVSLGLKLAPEKAGGALGKIAQSATNSAITERILSLHNAPTVNARVGEDLGLPTASPEALDQAMVPHMAVQNQVGRLGHQPFDPNFKTAVGAIRDDTTDLTALKAKFGQLPGMDASDALLEIRAQRALGFQQIKNSWQDPKGAAEGKGRLQLANALEDQLDRNLPNNPNVSPDLINQWRFSRQQMAKILSAKEALRGNNIFAGDLSQQLNRGVPLEGNMRTIAEAWENHDRVLQDPGRVRYAGPITFGDLALGGFGHFLHPVGAAALVGRPLTRAVLASDLYQKYGIRGGAGPATQPAAATPGLQALAQKYSVQPLPMPRFQGTPPAGPLGAGPLEPAPMATKPAATPAPTPFQYPDLAGAKPPSIVTGNPITDQFRQYLENHHDEARARYQAINDPDGVGSTLGGRVMSVDLARELSPHYVADRTLSDDVHEPGSDFIKKLYAERLAQPVESGYDPSILFTAGGTGAGKTSAIKRIPHVQAMADKAHIIYDTNIARAASAVDKIDRGKQAGLDSHVAYVYRDPAEALQNGTLPRAERMGRTVPLETHNITHEGSGNSIQELRQHYATDPHVTFSSIDNSLGKGKAVLSPVDLPDGKRYSAPAEELKDVVEQAYQAGKIGPRTYQGTIRGATAGAAGQPDRANPGAAGGGGEVPSGDRTEPGGQPQPERQAAPVTFEAPGAAPSDRPFLVARVGTSPALTNRNAGTPAAVAMHLARLEDVDRPQPAGVTTEGPQALYIHEVTPQESFGAYQRGDRGEMQPGSLGREADKNAVQYSFPEGSKYISRVVLQIPLVDLKAELKARTGTDSFDDLGGINGGQALTQIIQDRIRAATMKGIPATKPRVRAYPSVTTTSGEPITLEQLRKKYGAER